MDSNFKTIENIGEAIKSKRLELGISMAKLSADTGISRTTLWSIENGSTSVAIGSYFLALQYLGIDIQSALNRQAMHQNNSVRAPKKFSSQKMRKLNFETFCIESYAKHSKLLSSDVYSLFKKENLLKLLRSDYEDLHGMGTEYLMNFFDQYLRRI